MCAERECYNMKYISYLKNKNLSKNTINIYLKEYKKWKLYLNEKKPNKTLFVKYIKNYSKNHQPNSIRLIYFSILSIFKYEKNWKLVNQCKDIKLPKTQLHNKCIISFEEYNKLKINIKPKTKLEKRNWLIFSFLFLTGIRVSELLEVNKNKIYDNNKLNIKGKGQKTRVIFLSNYLLELLNNWKPNKIAINDRNKIISIKQINTIVKKIGKKYFDKNISPHSLRRSYATNLLRNNANIEVVRKTLGHTNINTTARYLHYNDDDIAKEINSIMDKN